MVPCACRLDAPEQLRESSLKYQTRCVAAFSGAASFAVASVEGRVAMEILDPSPEAQERKYAFKVRCWACFDIRDHAIQGLG